MTKPKVHKPKTIEEAIKDLQVFLESDLWYASHEEWKTEDDMLKYIQEHFRILKRQVKKLRK